MRLPDRCMSPTRWSDGLDPWSDECIASCGRRDALTRPQSIFLLGEMNMKLTPRSCLHCTRNFEPKRHWQYFCCRSCQQKYWRLWRKTLRKIAETSPQPQGAATFRWENTINPKPTLILRFNCPRTANEPEKADNRSLSETERSQGTAQSSAGHQGQGAR